MTGATARITTQLQTRGDQCVLAWSVDRRSSLLYDYITGEYIVTRGVDSMGIATIGNTFVHGREEATRLFMEQARSHGGTARDPDSIEVG